MSQLRYNLLEEFHICIRAGIIVRNAVWAIKKEENLHNVPCFLYNITSISLLERNWVLETVIQENTLLLRGKHTMKC